MDEKYIEKLLNGWEETYKKGQLTFWILLSLQEQSQYFDEIKDSIKRLTQGSLSCEDQSLYRALRKFYDLEMIDYELHKSERGPDKKFYSLTAIGKEVLSRFIERNIMIFQSPAVKDLLAKKNKI